MRVTVKLGSDEVAQTKRPTDIANGSDDVIKTTREFLRMGKLRELNKHR